MKKALPGFVKIYVRMMWTQRRLWASLPGPEFDSRYREGGMWRLTTEQLKEDFGIPEISQRVHLMAWALMFMFGYAVIMAVLLLIQLAAGWIR